MSFVLFEFHPYWDPEDRTVFLFNILLFFLHHVWLVHFSFPKINSKESTHFGEDFFYVEGSIRTYYLLCKNPTCNDSARGISADKNWPHFMLQRFTRFLEFVEFIRVFPNGDAFCRILQNNEKTKKCSS